MNENICVMQDDLKDCGVSCLLTIIRFYHGDISKESLREMTKTTKDGVSALYLMKAAGELGFATKALKGDITLLKQSDYPLIAHTLINNNYYHFVVIYGIKNGKVIIADPASGNKKVTIDEWNKISTGNYLLFKPLKRIPKLINEKKISNILYNFIIRYKKVFMIIFLFSLVYTILNILTSYNFKLLMDNSNLNSIYNIKKILYILIGFSVIKSIINLFRNKLMDYINYKLEKNLVCHIYQHLISLPYLYYKTRTCGDVITRINDVTNIKDLLVKIITVCFIDIILIIFILFMLMRINTKLTLITIALSGLYIIILLIYNRLIYPCIKEGYNQASIVNSYLVETIGSIETIKGLNMEGSVSRKLEGKYYKYIFANKKISNLIHSENFFKDLVVSLINLFVMYLGIKNVINNSISVTTLITYITLLAYYIDPVGDIVELNFIFKNAQVSLKRILELYQIPSEVLKISSKSIDRMIEGEIEFINVSFSYNGRNDILKNINFSIKAWSNVLICGDSGQGKSTIVKLMVKYLEDYSGKIMLDNRELQYYELADIRKNICYVSQSEILYTDTVYNNIVLNRTVNYDDFLNVCNMVKVEEFVSKMPFKYDTIIEENGFNLSGGERQRIILARTLLQKASIYIFDEALNAIDIKRERIILKNIFKMLINKTIIIISHRFNNEDLFDQKLSIGDLNG